MSTPALPLPRKNPAAPTLADALVRRSAVADIALVLGGAALTALSAQIVIPLWPVPVSGQTLAVMLVGATLGARRGAASLALYLVLGLVGLPIYAGAAGGLAQVVSPSFGYIVGFVPAAALAGWLSERRWDRRPLLAVLGFLAASLVPFAVGLPWLAAVLGLRDLGTVLAYGFTPFLVGGVVKWAIAAAVLPISWRLLRRRDRAE